MRHKVRCGVSLEERLGSNALLEIPSRVKSGLPWGIPGHLEMKMSDPRVKRYLAAVGDLSYIGNYDRIAKITGVASADPQVHRMALESLLSTRQPQVWRVRLPEGVERLHED